MRLHSALPTFVVLTLGSAGCLIERQNLQGPVEDDANALGVDAPGLDAWRPDAFSATDAFNPNDAFTPVDTFTPPDAFVAPDVFTPPDAFVPPDSGCNGRDDDGDGLRDPCDPWPCGAMPVIAASVSGEQITISAVRIRGGGNTLVARGGDTVIASMNYTIVDTACPGCIDQIQVGSVPGGFEGCIYDGVPGGSGVSGNALSSFSMPTVSRPTRVDLRFNQGQAFGCSSDWWGDEPNDAQTFGVVCVMP